LSQQQDQSNLNTAYSDFLENRDWGQSRLDALIRALSGTPYSKTTTGTQVTQNPSAFGQVAGLGLGIAGLL